MNRGMEGIRGSELRMWKLAWLAPLGALVQVMEFDWGSERDVRVWDLKENSDYWVSHNQLQGYVS